MVTESDADAISPWYLTGFAESGGSFTYHRSGEQLTLVATFYISDNLKCKFFPLHTRCI